jgi:hypothetical protein
MILHHKLKPDKYHVTENSKHQYYLKAIYIHKFTVYRNYILST